MTARNLPVLKYPRTPHLVGSGLQPDDDPAGRMPVEALEAEDFVFEEKIDGANAAVSFTPGGELVLQSRGHALGGGPREAQFALFKAWARAHEAAFRAILGSRFVMYGEWCYAKHTCYYDALPHYFLEFDLYDREREAFLSTPARHRFLDGLPVASVPVVHRGRPAGLSGLTALLRPSLYRSPGWETTLAEAARAAGVPLDRAMTETDAEPLAEGLYLKLEAGDRVVGRYKYIRPGFLQAIFRSGGHWAERPIIANALAPGVDIFAGG